MLHPCIPCPSFDHSVNTMLGDKLSTKKLRCTPLGWRIRDDALQQSFRAKYPAMCVAPAKVYSVFWVLASGWSMVAYLGHPLTPAFYGLFVPLAVGILLYLSSLHPFTKRHMELLLTIAVVLLVLWNGGMFFIHMDYWYSQYTGMFTSLLLNTKGDSRDWNKGSRTRGNGRTSLIYGQRLIRNVKVVLGK